MTLAMLVPSGASDVCARDVTIQLLGPLQINGPLGVLTAADFPTRKAKQAFAVLALACGQPVSKDRLVDLLWSEKLPRDPTATVEHAISMLRSAIAHVSANPVILTDRGRYRIDLTVASIDLMEFDNYVETAGNLSGQAGVEMLRSADRLVHGELLEAEPHTSWVFASRDRYHERHLAALLGIARRSLACDDPESAVDAARRARLASDDVLEDAYALEVAALIRLGHHHAARRLLLEVEQRLADDFGTAPSQQTVTLKLFLREASTPSVGRVQGSVATCLDSATEHPPFTGRGRELAAANAAIRSARRGESQFVIFSGASGSGKSSLLSRIGVQPNKVTVVDFPCLPSDRDAALMFCSRLLRRLARLTGVPVAAADGRTPAATFAQLADQFDQLGPSLLTIDDLDHVDGQSLAILIALISLGGVEGLCIIATAHPNGFGDDEAALTAALTHIALPNLSQAEIDALGIPHAWTESGGNPATLAACIEGARAGGVLTTDGVQAILRRVQEVGALALMLLPLIASETTPFNFEDLAYFAGLARSTIAEWAEVPISLGLLRDLGDGGIEFSDSATRRVLTRRR